jgi:hypothetical protein
MVTVCPNPIPWNNIYQLLHKVWHSCGAVGEPPPVPLILGGWIYNNDLQKLERWHATIEWATRHRLQHIIGMLSTDDWYRVPELSTHEIGPLGGPMFLPWNFEPKPRPSSEAILMGLKRLQQQWSAIAGPQLADHTKPLRFTGQKYRHLLVQANPTIEPPWGNWNKLAFGEQRRTFTRLRKSVNDVICPLLVDHIDFLIVS